MVAAVEARSFPRRDDLRRLIALPRECGRRFLGITGESFEVGEGIRTAVPQGMTGDQCAIARRLEAIGGATCG